MNLRCICRQWSWQTLSLWHNRLQSPSNLSFRCSQYKYRSSSDALTQLVLIDKRDVLFWAIPFPNVFDVLGVKEFDFFSFFCNSIAFSGFSIFSIQLIYCHFSLFYGFITEFCLFVDGRWLSFLKTSVATQLEILHHRRCNLSSLDLDILILDLDILISDKVLSLASCF